MKRGGLEHQKELSGNQSLFLCVIQSVFVKLTIEAGLVSQALLQRENGIFSNPLHIYQISVLICIPTSIIHATTQLTVTLHAIAVESGYQDTQKLHCVNSETHAHTHTNNTPHVRAHTHTHTHTHTHARMHTHTDQLFVELFSESVAVLLPNTSIHHGIKEHPPGRTVTMVTLRPFVESSLHSLLLLPWMTDVTSFNCLWS